MIECEGWQLLLGQGPDGHFPLPPFPGAGSVLLMGTKRRRAGSTVRDREAPGGFLLSTLTPAFEGWFCILARTPARGSCRWGSDPGLSTSQVHELGHIPPCSIMIV